MISIITCSRQDLSWDIHQRNVKKTAGASVQYIRIDNRDNQYNLCSAYNEGIKKAQGEILVFMHEDTFFVEGGWADKLEKKFEDQSLGLIGIAGTQYLFPNNPVWFAAGRPFIKGQVIHELDRGSRYFLTVFNWERGDSEVVAVDGLFFAVRKSIFDKIQFDEVTFDGFHFYDLDICMQIRKAHRIIVTTDIMVKHQSGGAFDNTWKKYAVQFIEKYRTSLPAFCTNIVPDIKNIVPFENYDLKGKVPQLTII